ncbi:PulJ/GspJ family protein [Nocardioides jejuensis]|uniref:Prepilin-type N-terminal cleavage/methylation domain-containing protein n=1 Tax=Nocardioides jejuensis TaxID=2502782 RepID=A0A4R1CIC2_9ACTN|nr:prepilin-type N-terminal cleavage/methylation domain-containing protein [Nocardioides jejuensis]TCJ31214.1 prepilin-type N-terminal cleavage/methylation domain-containing protein [Nocardioides jejuensis]
MLSPRRDEDGFTLIELVVTVAILGIIVVALIGVVFGYLRTSNETSTRLNESTDQQFVSAYWQQDVSSFGVRGKPSGGTIPTSQAVWEGTAPGCAPSSGGALVMFAWNDFKSAPTDDKDQAWDGASSNRATYYTKTVANSNGTSQVQLWRKRCGDTTSDIVVARHLTGVPTVTCYSNAGAATGCTGTSPYPATVRISMDVQDLSQTVHASTGYSNLTLTAQRRQG